MSNVSGADLEQLYTLGKNFCSDADQLETLITAIDNQIAASQWTGVTASQWQGTTWAEQFKPTLKNIAEGTGGLRQTGEWLKSQAQAIATATGGTVG